MTSELHHDFIECIKTFVDALPIDLHAPTVHAVVTSLHLGKTVPKMGSDYACGIKISKWNGVFLPELLERSGRYRSNCKVGRVASERRPQGIRRRVRKSGKRCRSALVLSEPIANNKMNFWHWNTLLRRLCSKRP